VLIFSFYLLKDDIIIFESAQKLILVSKTAHSSMKN